VGFELYREVIRYAPDDLDTGELALLLVLADNANEKKRTCAPGQEEICRWMRMEWSGVKAVLRRLAKHKIEVRIVVGKDKLDRDVYAHHGARTTYIIPHFGPVPVDCRCPEHSDAALEGGATATPSAGEGGTSATPADSNGVATATPSVSEGVATASRRGSHSDPHLPRFPQEEDPPLPKPQRIVRDAQLGLTEEEEEMFIAWANHPDQKGPHTSRWWETVSQNGDLPIQAARWRTAHAATHARDSPPESVPKCDACNPDRLVEDEDGNRVPCPTCHPKRKATP
jgi:hypothetical protein